MRHVCSKPRLNETFIFEDMNICAICFENLMEKAKNFKAAFTFIRCSVNNEKINCKRVENEK